MSGEPSRPQYDAPQSSAIVGRLSSTDVGAAECEQLIDRFEDAWLRNERPQIQDYVFLEVGEGRVNLLRELVHIDFEYRYKRGEQSRVDVYFAAFPQLLDDVESAIELILTEFNFRRRFGERPTIAEYDLRFPKFAGTLTSRLCETEEMEGTDRGGKTKFIESLASPLRAPTRTQVYLPAIVGYEILEELGRGGMGIVYRACHTRLERVVALKIIRESLLADQVQLNRFEDEAKAIARLDHPNIIKIHEIGDCQGQPFFSMEFADCGSLADQIALFGPLAPRDAAAIGKAIAQAVQHAHEHNVLHRDLKPMNIVLVSRQDTEWLTETKPSLLNTLQPKITDFGLAKLLGSDSRHSVSGEMLGTPNYMAPEQLPGHTGSVTVATDVYALGAVLYELLTGRPVFRGADLLETLQQVRNCEPVAMRDLNPGIPRDLETICVKCLSKVPQHRYASARLVVEELDRFLDGAPILSRPLGTLASSWRWCRRNPLASMLLGTVALALTGTAAATFFAIESKQHQTAERINAETAKQLRNQYEIELEQTRASRITAQLWRAAESLEHDPWKSRELLNDVSVIEPHDRDFAWRLYAQRCQAVSELLPIEVGPVAAFAVNQNARLLATAEKDGGGQVTCWEWMADGLQFISRIPNSQETVFDLALSPDGGLLAIAGNTIQLWDIAAQQPRHVLHEHARSVSFNHNGTVLASGDYHAWLRLWNVSTGEQVSSFNNNTLGIYAVEFSPDGLMLATGNRDWTVRTHSITTGKELRVLRTGHTEDRHRNTVYSLAFSPDSHTLASCSRDQTIFLWDMERNSRPRVLFGHGKPVRSVVFSPDGKSLVSAGDDNALRIWDTASGEQRLVLRGEVGSGTRVAFTPDGKAVISQGRDGRLRAWKTSFKPEPTAFYGHSISGITVTFSHDSRTVASAGHDDGRVLLWNVDSDRPTASLHSSANVTGLAFSNDGQMLAAAGDHKGTTVELWRLSNLKDDQSPVALLEQSEAGMVCVAFSPDGTKLASGGGTWDADREEYSEGQVYLWSIESGEMKSIARAHATEVLTLIFSPDGRFLATSAATADRRGGEVKIWDVLTHRVVNAFAHTNVVKELTFAPDGHSLIGASDGAIVTWDLPTGTIRHTSHLYSGEISCVAFSADQQTLATATEDRNIYLWNLSTGQHRATLGGHSARITGVAFSSDGRFLTTASADGAMLLHRANFPE